MPSVKQLKELAQHIESYDLDGIFRLTLGGELPEEWGRVDLIMGGSLDEAVELHQAVLPGWLYRVGSCHLSDDAFVAPDFNCPKHGERLRREIPPLINGQEWSEYTDIDQRPAGFLPRALLHATLVALIGIKQIRELQEAE